MTGTVTRPDTTRVTDRVDWLTTHLPELYEARFKGTARHWRETTMPAHAIAERDRLARIERVERSGYAPGEHPAPLHLDVLDTITEVKGKISTAWSYCGAATVWPPDAQRHLRQIADHIHEVADQDTVDVVASLLGDAQILTAGTIATYDLGTPIKVTCPWCLGRTTEQPNGGARTLRMHTFHPTPYIRDGRLEHRDARQPLIACHGVDCNPPVADCSERYRERPAWLQLDWEWLYARIEELTLQRTFLACLIVLADAKRRARDERIAERIAKALGGRG